MKQKDDTYSSSSSVGVILPTRDYLFRHDRGSFWMASYRIPNFIGKFMGSILDSRSMFRYNWNFKIIYLVFCVTRSLLSYCFNLIKIK
jgi:hypothetical protein